MIIKDIYKNCIVFVTVLYLCQICTTSFRFMPSFIRLGSWNICMFVTFEQLKRLFTHISQGGRIMPVPRVYAAMPPAVTTRDATPLEKSYFCPVAINQWD